MKVLICAETYERGVHKLEELANEIRKEHTDYLTYSCNNTDYIIQFVKGKDNAYFTTKDGDLYKVIHNSTSSRGHKCDKIYIGKSVDEETTQDVLIPMLIVSKLPQEEQIVYF